eukprot:TRINITY_DN5858_c0_g1_i1.p1 TRINITY_DN5858_c0_g1~~TRINITY_DN5858_c0_g1_i1.p1  ORF type:complete len:224 (+),score=21.79 TRINITY_DN5858_c0_g1_i1:145-816(+)
MNFTNLILVPAIFISGEGFKWGAEFRRVQSIGGNSLTIFIIISIATALAKQLEYLSKFAVVARVSALFEAVMDIFRRIIVIVVIVVLFDEGFTVEKFVSLALVVIGFIVYVQTGRMDLARKAREAKEVLQQKLLTESGPDEGDVLRQMTNHKWILRNFLLENVTHSMLRRQKFILQWRMGLLLREVFLGSMGNPTNLRHSVKDTFLERTDGPDTAPLKSVVEV